MKYIITVELALKEDEIIGAKEQIAAALENIGDVRIAEVKIANERLCD
jgi:hypothetical protein